MYFNLFQPEAVMHLAAEISVDRSIDNAGAFIQTNIQGTFQLLETSLRYWKKLKSSRHKKPFVFTCMPQTKFLVILMALQTKLNEDTSLCPKLALFSFEGCTQII